MLSSPRWSPLFLSISFYIFSSPSFLPYWSLKMFSGKSFNGVNPNSWKPPNQGHFIVTLRWNLLCSERENIHSPESHKDLPLSLFSSVFQFSLNTWQCWLYKRHVGNSVLTVPRCLCRQNQLMWCGAVHQIRNKRFQIGLWRWQHKLCWQRFEAIHVSFRIYLTARGLS